MLLTPTLFLLGLGLGSAVLLAIFSKIFYVWEDPKVVAVEEALLGANCGGCGYPGCSGAAAAVIAGKAGADVCVAGGADVALKVALVLGVEVEIKEPEVAYTSCTYSVADADTKYTYTGINDCRAAVLFDGGPKVCPIGCVGLGSCVRACPFGAITMGSHGLPVFNRKKCRACGICVQTCPKNIIYLTSTTNRIIGDYKNDECTTPCQRACPTGINIPAYIKQISLGNHREAVRIIKERNPLPLIVGRICPAPCELECRRILADEPIAINNLKRYAADYEMENDERVYPYVAPGTDRRVAVIGGGAEGLSASFYLACLGHSPTIYEATSKLGGIIRNVIAKTRLPDRIIDWEIDGILELGVRAELEKRLGKEITIAGLLTDGYEAVVLSTGGIDSRKILRSNIDFEQTIPGVYTLLDFLVATERAEKISVGKNVCIIGCGNSTLRAAEICRKKGAQSITIVHPYSRDDLISRKLEIGKAESEGIRFILLSVVNRLSGQGDALTAVKIRSVDGVIQENIPVDTLIVSSGRISDIVFVRDTDEETGEPLDNKWHTLETAEMFPDNQYGDIFNLGENAVANDTIAVVKAIGRGRRLSRAVHLYLGNKKIAPQENAIKKDDTILNIESIVRVQRSIRNRMPKNEEALSNSPADVFFSSAELETGYNLDLAKGEAGRCLQCGLICYRKDEAS